MADIVVCDYATILGELLRGAPDGKPYKIGAMYVEFENNGGVAVTPPTPLAAEGKSYYDGLLTHPTRDYLRVPATAVLLDSTDAALYPGGNRLTVIAQTAGVAGVHGKIFSDTVSSRVYGGALVSTPDYGDQTQDLVYARFYYAAASQMVKLASSQLWVRRELVFQAG